MKIFTIKNLSALLFFALLSTTAFAQDDARVDSVIANQERILANQEAILADTGSEPLAGKTFGVEFNPAMALGSLGGSDFIYLAGGASFFGISRSAEVAVPVLYYGTSEFNYFGVSGRYRKFLGRHQKGFFLSGGVSFRSVNTEIYDFDTDTTTDDSFRNVGVSFGLGYRIFSHSGFYWGTSLSVGRYFGDSDEVDSGLVSGGSLLIDFEILKFGYAF